MAGVGQHFLVHHLHQVGARLGRHQMAFDGRQAEERLAIGEGQGRPHLEDGEVVAHQVPQRGPRLIVGGVGLVHQGPGFDEPRQAARGGGPVGHDEVVAELHAGLHHQGHHPLPGRVQPAAAESRAHDLQGAAGVLHPRGRDRVLVLLRAAGRRHLGAHHIHRRRATHGLMRGLGHRGQPCGALGHRLGGGHRRIAAQGHAAIQVNFTIAGLHIGPHQSLGLAHGRFGRAVTPHMRAQVVAAQHQALLGEPLLLGHAVQQGHEIPRLQARVAAVLVHLIAGGLDEQGEPTGGRVAQRDAQHLGVRGAQGGRAHGLTRFVGRQQVTQPHGSTPPLR